MIRRVVLLLLLKLFLWLHSFSYRMSGLLAMKLEGIHPKHRIMKYHEFFINNIDEDDIVLDVGCGNGILTYEIAKKAKRVVGIDIDEKRIEFAKKNFSRENIVYICGDATQYIPEEEFDVIVLSNVLEHIQNRVKFH